MSERLLKEMIAAVPPGAWAVGVSGGADSVALLLLLSQRSNLQIHAVHLDHQTRSGESARDASFVTELARTLGLPATVACRSDVESSMDRLAKNISSRYRSARLALFRRVVSKEKLQGVLLAHHADDQAETVLMRILRGAAAENLAGIRAESVVSGLRIVRPLLCATRLQLRSYLEGQRQSWREDSSNESDDYQRNRLRRWLTDRPGAAAALLQVEAASRALREWLDHAAPALEESFAIELLSQTPAPLARHAAGRWLAHRGAPPAEVSRKVCQRLVAMCMDAASPAKQHFPGSLLVRRRAGILFVDQRA